MTCALTILLSDKPIAEVQFIQKHARYGQALLELYCTNHICANPVPTCTWLKNGNSLENKVRTKYIP